MFRSSLWFMLVSVVVGGGLLSLSTEAVAGQPATPTSLQETRDAVGAVAQQMGQVTRDTSLTQDAKVQQINELAVQFNRLVSQLQQLDCGQACPPAPATTPPATMPPATLAAPPSANQTKDQIVALGQQVGQVSLDSALSQDAKVQQINALAIEVNKLQSQLQRSDCGTACAQSNTGAANPSTAAPPASIAQSPANVSTPAPAVPPAALASPVSGEQARADIAAVAQKVGEVMQDGTLSPDARAQQINVLATQFNQLVSQLQQQPGAPQPTQP
jgi:HAMP domain-containing protein